jgi:transposase
MSSMATVKYLALDVHQATSTYSLRDAKGKVVHRGVVATTPHELIGLVRRFRPNLHVTFEEGAQAQWLHDLLEPECAQLVVCNPRANRSKLANKSDRIDADLLSDLLRLGALRPVFHARLSTRALKEYVRAYVTLMYDSVRAMLRIKAIYRGRGIPTRGDGVYRPALRREWLDRLADPATRRRAELLLAELDALSGLRRRAKTAMLAEARKHPGFHLLGTFPVVGPIRAAELVAMIGSPHRFRTKRHLWPYAGLAVVRQSSADHQITDGRVERRKREPLTRGLNRNFNRTLKKIFKAIAVDLSHGATPLARAHRARLDRGIPILLSARSSIAARTFLAVAMWKKGVPYDADLIHAPSAT